MRWKTLLLVVLALPVVVIASITGAHGSTQAYVCINGADGDSLVQADCIDIFEFHHLVKGEPLEHESIVFVKKRNDRSTVNLLWLLHNNDRTDVNIYFTVAVPERRTYLELQLRHAAVLAIEPWSRDGGNEELERVRLDYDELQIEHTHYPQSGGSQSESYQIALP